MISARNIRRCILAQEDNIQQRIGSIVASHGVPRGSTVVAYKDPHRVFVNYIDMCLAVGDPMPGVRQSFMNRPVVWDTI